jgi:alpha-L-rhamnosidase
MSTKTLIFTLLTIVALTTSLTSRVNAADSAAWSVSGLQCEYHVNPLGIDQSAPRLQWIVESSERDQIQTAYRILVASSASKLSSGQGDLWDSGRIESNTTNQIAYHGQHLVSNEQCYWKVQTWSRDGKLSAWSAPAQWSMGLLSQSDWKARWIGYDAAYNSPVVAEQTKHHLNVDGASWLSLPTNGQAPDRFLFVRKQFSLQDNRKLTKATLALYCDNECAAQINGQNVGTAYRWEPTALLDATGAIHSGANIISLNVTNNDLSQPQVIGRLILQFDTGDDLVIPLDQTCRVSSQSSTGWQEAAYNDQSWSSPATGGTPWGTPSLSDILRTPVPYLRTTFAVKSRVVRATLFATALGLYEIHLNGHRVGENYFTPGWTDFRKRVNYETYDVTPLVHSGPNAIGAMLGDGWYASTLAFTGKRNWYGGSPRLMAQLVLQYADGTIQTVATDSSWKANFGPYRQADLQLGAVYDGRVQLPGWDQTQYDDSAWSNVDVGVVNKQASGTSDVTDLVRAAVSNDQVSLTVTNDSMGGDPAYGVVKDLIVVYSLGAAEHSVTVPELGTLNLAGAPGSPLKIVSAMFGQNIAPQPLPVPQIQADPAEPVRIDNVISAIKLAEPKPGIFTFDLGQNMVGWTRLKISGLPGQKITVRHGEMLNPDGTVYQENLRSASGTDIYYLSGNGVETLEPVFTLKGFRYVEVQGLTSEPTLQMVTGVVVHSDMSRTGSFTCSNPLVNQLYSNTVWSQKGNYIAVPTDCPQRDERAGWTGDAEFFMRTGAYNYDVSSFFTGWLETLCEDSQHADGSFAHVAPDLNIGSGSTAWGDAALQCTYHMYEVYGDTRIIDDHYAAMNRYMDFLAAHSSNYIANVGGFGDWLNLGGGASSPVIDTSYYAYLAGIMSEMASATGRVDDASKFQELHDNIRKAFIQNFILPDGSIKDSSQTGYALAFTMDLVPDNLRSAVTDNFAEQLQKFNWHLATGFIGTPRLLPALHDAGLDNDAYKILLQETYPGWLYPVKLGATTMWEHWDSWTPDKGFEGAGMNSFNHYSFGAVAQYLYANVAGIDTDGPGFRKIIIRPEIESGLTSASGSYNSISGLISTSWQVHGNGLSLDVTIPTNTTATVYVPSADGSVREGQQSADSAEGVRFVGREGISSIFKVGSGVYHFQSIMPQ